MSKSINYYFLFAALLCSSVVSSFGGVVASENFGTLANGTTITTSDTSLTYARVSAGANSLLYATNDQFSGSSAVLLATSASLTGIGTSGLTAFTVGTFNCSVFSSATLSTLAIFMGTGTTFTGNSTFAGADLTAGVQFVSGQMQTRNSANVWANVGAVGFAANTVYNISIDFNDSASTVTYGSQSVAAGAADIWVNGTLFGDDVSIRGAQSVTAFRIYTTSSTAPLEIDNISLANSISPVPEPSTLAFATFGGLASLFILRRRR